jgi:hypothetical protein
MNEQKVKEELKRATMDVIKEVERTVEKIKIEKAVLEAKNSFGEMEKIEDITQLIADVIISGVMSRAKANCIDLASYPMMKELARREGWE